MPKLDAVKNGTGVSMEIVLYYAPITCALAPFITLTEAGESSRFARSISERVSIPRPST